MRPCRLLMLMIALSMVAVACGGGGDDGVAATTSTEPASPVDDPATIAGDTASEEVPMFLDDLSRVCTTQVGFGGVDGYAPGTGVNPMVLFEEYREDGNFIQSPRAFPAGWAVTEDADFEDPSELAATRLVACADQVRATPNGTSCEFDSEGESVRLELVDAVYELTIYEAATGEPVGQASTLEATSTECPHFVSFQEGDTQYVNEPTDDQYINALRPFVEG